MPKSAPGSRSAQPSPPPRRRAGFTLIELLVVIAIIAIASAVATLALRDPRATQLERDAARLVALLESARSEARAGALAVRWQPRSVGADGADSAAADFTFSGLPAALGFPSRWLAAGVRAEVVGGTAVALGPEPLIGAQRIDLRLGEQRLTLATDGLEPFAVTGSGTASGAR